MKILVDGHFLDGKKHGASNFIERTYSEYSTMAQHHEIYFGVEPNAPVDYALFDMPGVHVLRYRFGGALRFIWDIPLLARKIRPDIVHTHYVLPLRCGYFAKRHVTLFDVLYEDYPQLFGKVYRLSRHFIFGWSAKRADMLSTCSEYSRDRIRARYKPDIAEIHVMHGGVMAESKVVSASPLLQPQRDFLMYVSRFEKRKNHLNLLKAFVVLLREYPQLQLVLVGFEVDGSLAECERFIETNEMRGSVEILSNISDSHLTNLFRTASVVVYPSLCEGFGMPIIESMLLNSHTIFSNTTAMADFTFASENMFDPNDVDAIAEKVRKELAMKGTDRPEWREQCRFIANTYSWNRAARVLLEIHSPIAH